MAIHMVRVGTGRRRLQLRVSEHPHVFPFFFYLVFSAHRPLGRLEWMKVATNSLLHILCKTSERTCVHLRHKLSSRVPPPSWVMFVFAGHGLFTRHVLRSRRLLWALLIYATRSKFHAYLVLPAWREARSTRDCCCSGFLLLHFSMSLCCFSTLFRGVLFVVCLFW